VYRIDIITIFPEIFENFLKTSFIKKAQDKKKIIFDIHNLRNFCTDKHRKVDDEPFGGGAGMILKPEPIFSAIRHIKQQSNSNPYIILLTPQGNVFNQSKARHFVEEHKHLVFVCGRYEGFDERICELIDEELSIGDFVLSGGEIPSMVVCEAIVRLLPDVIGKKASFENDSFYDRYLDYPQYTRPAEFEGLKVPEVLINGNHKEIEKWRKEKAILNTYKKRPDLLTKEEIERIKETK
jgi:tRNA (guanine37-N1)-methyltransferase